MVSQVSVRGGGGKGVPPNTFTGPVGAGGRCPWTNRGPPPGQATPRAVRLLGSHRRTFLFALVLFVAHNWQLFCSFPN